MMRVKETVDLMMTVAISFIFFCLGCFWSDGD